MNIDLRFKLFFNSIFCLDCFSYSEILPDSLSILPFQSDIVHSSDKSAKSVHFGEYREIMSHSTRSWPLKNEEGARGWEEARDLASFLCI